MRASAILMIVFAASVSTEETKGEAEKPGHCFKLKVINRNNLTKIDVEHDEGSIIEAAAESCGGKRVLNISIFSSETRRRRVDYELFPGYGYYKIHTVGADWESARTLCQAEDAQLMEINSAEEKNVAISFLLKKLAFTGATWPDWAWIGVRKTGGEYKTVSGIPLKSAGYSKWHSGEPNADGECVLIHITGTLADQVCAKAAAFLCEQPL